MPGFRALFLYGFLWNRCIAGPNMDWHFQLCAWCGMLLLEPQRAKAFASESRDVSFGVWTEAITLLLCVLRVASLVEMRHAQFVSWSMCSRWHRFGRQTVQWLSRSQADGRLVFCFSPLSRLILRRPYLWHNAGAWAGWRPKEAEESVSHEDDGTPWALPWTSTSLIFWAKASWQWNQLMLRWVHWSLCWLRWS